MALPFITTNAVGCREVVDDGINGYLCQVRDAVDLTAKMEAEFDERIVIGKYLAAIAELMTTD